MNRRIFFNRIARAAAAIAAIPAFKWVPMPRRNQVVCNEAMARSFFHSERIDPETVPSFAADAMVEYKASEFPLECRIPPKGIVCIRTKSHPTGEGSGDWTDTGKI